MNNNTFLMDFYKRIDLPEDIKICFETLDDLIDNNIIRKNDLERIENKKQFFEFSDKTRKDIIYDFCSRGVIIYSSDGIIISPFVRIEPQVTILPGTIIIKDSYIKNGSTIGPNSYIDNSTIGNNCSIISSVIRESIVEDNVSIGPFSQLRPNSHVCKNVKIGDFVEVKNSFIDEGTHASHLTYIGDSNVGKNVNFGCGTVISNYNGYKKFRSTIGDNSFIGCNTNIISPVNIGDNAYTAAGSTITEDVPDGALGIARQRQTNKVGWAFDFKEKNSKDK